MINPPWASQLRVRQDELREIRQVVAAESAFAALRSDGHVITWGRADIGGDSSAVTEQLSHWARNGRATGGTTGGWMLEGDPGSSQVMLGKWLDGLVWGNA